MKDVRGVLEIRNWKVSTYVRLCRYCRVVNVASRRPCVVVAVVWLAVCGQMRWSGVPGRYAVSRVGSALRRVDEFSVLPHITRSVKRSP